MKKAFYIESVSIVDYEDLGKFVQVNGSPYENTPFGTSKNYFKAVKFNLPYDQYCSKLDNEIQEEDDIILDPSDFFYDGRYGYVPNSCREQYQAILDRDAKKEKSGEFMCNDFDMSELAMLSQGFNRSLFTRPNPADIQWKEQTGGQGCTLFFRKQYLIKLIEEYQSAKNSGRFASSNANTRWLALLDRLKTSRPAYIDEMINLKEYKVLY